MPKHRVPTWDEWNDLLDWMQDNRPIEGLGIRINDADGQGKQINAIGQDTPSSVNSQPFQLINSSEGSTIKIRIRYGTVNSIIPDGMSPGDTPPYILTINIDVGVIYLIVTTDDDFLINDVSIDFAAELPEAPDDFTFYRSLGTFSVDGKTVSLAQDVRGSQQFKWCGTGLFALS